MWRLPAQSSLPPVALDANITRYNERFKSKTDDDIRESVTSRLDRAAGNAETVESALTAFRELQQQTQAGGLIVSNIRKISEPHLRLIFQAIASFELDQWAPDIQSNDPDSLYNLLHEHLAISTFQQISVAFGYTHMANNLHYVRNLPILRKMYRSFVFSYMAGIAKAEAKKPGAQANAIVMSNTYRRREKVSAHYIHG